MSNHSGFRLLKGLGVQGLGVQGLGFRARDLRCRASVRGFRIRIFCLFACRRHWSSG